MKGVFALAALALLAGCSSMNMFNKAEPEGKWTTWTCDSKAEVNWRFANQARSEVDVASAVPTRFIASNRMWRLRACCTATTSWRFTQKVRKAWFTGLPLTI